MLNFDQMRKIDPELAHLSDTELAEVRLALYDAAQLAFEVYWGKKHGSKCPVRSFPSSEIGSTI